MSSRLRRGGARNEPGQSEMAHTLGAGDGLDAARAHADVKLDGALQERHAELGALALDQRQHASDLIKDDGAVAGVH